MQTRHKERNTKQNYRKGAERVHKFNQPQTAKIMRGGIRL